MKYVVKKSILGFENIEEVELEKNDGVTTILKGCENNCINMTLINTFKDDSNFEVPASIKALLDIDDNTNYSVYFIVVIAQDIRKSTINLGAPLIFNEDNQTMAQAVINLDSMLVEDVEK